MRLFFVLSISMRNGETVQQNVGIFDFVKFSNFFVRLQIVRLNVQSFEWNAVYGTGYADL